MTRATGFFLVLETGIREGERRSGKRGVFGDSGEIGASAMRGAYRIVAGSYLGQRRGGGLLRRIEVQRTSGNTSVLPEVRKYFRYPYVQAGML